MKLLIASIIILLGSPSWSSTSCKTKYPIVLAHGLFGFSGSIGFYTYWSDIPDTLRKCGAVVYLAHVSQANQTEERGEQLHRQLLHWGHKKYNIIGHSHGGLDARYVLENYPDIVASVSTVGTPHRGSKVADRILLGLNGRGFLEISAAFFGNCLGYSIAFLSGHFNWQDIRRAMDSLTTEALATFNELHPIGLSPEYCEAGDSDYHGTRLYSWGSYGPEPSTYFDWIGYLLQRAAQIFAPDEKNDGLVGLCSMKFGQWLGAMPRAHHLIPVGGILSPLPTELLGWPDEMFREHGKRLKGDGV